MCFTVGGKDSRQIQLRICTSRTVPNGSFAYRAVIALGVYCS